MESGADIIDIGGQSTRPTSTKVSPDEEIKRVIPIIRALREEENSWMKVGFVNKIVLFPYPHANG